MLGFRLPFTRRKGGGMGATGGTGYPVFLALVFDQFTDTNGTALTAHTIAPTNTPGVSWSVQATTTWTINSNAASNTNNGGSWAAQIGSVGESDVTVSVDVTFPNATDYQGGVRARVVDVSNEWDFLGWRATSGTPQLLIRERTTSTNTVRASTNDATLTNATCTIAAKCSGNNLELYKNGVSTLTYSSTVRNTATIHGIFGYKDATYTAVVLDNFLVTKP